MVANHQHKGAPSQVKYTLKTKDPRWNLEVVL